MNRIEALADAIAHYSGFNDPDSPAYQNRNPGKLMAYLDHQPRDSEGIRTFRTVLDGYQALLFDLKVKCSGRSHTKLRQTSTLRDLILSRNQPAPMAKHVANFLRRALHNESISEKTELGYFLEVS